jgi:hypothetical protein
MGLAAAGVGTGSGAPTMMLPTSMTLYSTVGEIIITDGILPTMGRVSIINRTPLSAATILA